MIRKGEHTTHKYFCKQKDLLYGYLLSEEAKKSGYYNEKEITQLLQRYYGNNDQTALANLNHLLEFEVWRKFVENGNKDAIPLL